MDNKVAKYKIKYGVGYCSHFNFSLPYLQFYFQFKRSINVKRGRGIIVKIQIGNCSVNQRRLTPKKKKKKPRKKRSTKRLQPTRNFQVNLSQLKLSAETLVQILSAVGCFCRGTHLRGPTRFLLKSKKGAANVSRSDCGGSCRIVALDSSSHTRQETFREKESCAHISFTTVVLTVSNTLWLRSYQISCTFNLLH